MNELKLEQMFQELLDLIKQIKDPILKEIAQELLLEHKNEIMNRAGSPDRYENNEYIIGNHHFFKGGLLCHLYGATKMALRMISEVKDQINLDLVLFGSSLHDLGKIYTYHEWKEERELKCPVTEHAKMLQHSYLGMELISKKFDQYHQFDPELREQALHIIASHMDEYEGGLVKPITVEARIVRFAERTDCMLSHYLYK